MSEGKVENVTPVESGEWEISVVDEKVRFEGWLEFTEEGVSCLPCYVDTVLGTIRRSLIHFLKKQHNARVGYNYYWLLGENDLP